MMPAPRLLRKDGSGPVWSELVAVRAIPSLLDDVRAGLLQPPRWLPPKYFYDERGSELFERICATPEYYPTRTEDALLQAISGELLELTQPHHVVELGSGSSRKTRRVFDACAALGIAPVYWPCDVSREMLLASAEALYDDYPWLDVHAVVGDYHAGLANFPHPDGPALWLFLGGTIGNFAAHEAVAFLREIAVAMGDEGQLLLAVDRIKDAARLNAAYNDGEGITAAFNLNVLEVLNRELGSDFDLAGFAHRALFNADAEQIEMYLDATRAQTVTIPPLQCRLEFAAGDSIRTEISRKFSCESLRAMLQQAGLCERRIWHAPDEDYTLVLAATAPG